MTLPNSAKFIFDTSLISFITWAYLNQKLVVGRDQLNQKKALREDPFNLFGLEASSFSEGLHKF